MQRILVKRIALIYFLLMMLLFIGVCRLLWLTTSEKSLQATVGQGAAVLEIGTSRGIIYDRGGRPLTDSEEYWLALCSPAPQAIALFSELPGLSDIAERLKQGRPVAAEVPDYLSAEGITMVRLHRRYSESQPAVHIIGYLDSTGMNGVTGIEKSYNEILQGGRRTARFAVDGRGVALTGIAPVIADAGSGKAGSVTLTLDRDIQRIAEAAAESLLSAGAVVVMEVNTGKLLAVVSVPSFSPSAPGESLNDPSAPMINRAFCAYNVGSVFKLVVAAAALDQGISPSYRYHCTGKLRVGDLTFNCHSTHGTVDMATAIRQSCNVYFIDLAGAIGAKPIHRVATALGFGTSRSICPGITPEPGRLTNLSLLLDQPATLANFAFGQGDLMLTPLQITSLTAAIAAGGRSYTPALVESVKNAAGQEIDGVGTPVFTKVMSEDTARKLQEYMIGVVESGTGSAGKPSVGRAGGKTGTAETGWIKDGRRVVQAWFSGFYPAENPRYAITIISEDGQSGGRSSGPVFKQIVEEIAALEDSQRAMPAPWR